VAISAEGGRALGCLVEKQLTTPTQYPLTLNALALACSQSTNRDPVMAMDEPTVQSALQELKELRLVRFVLPSHGRSVTRYRHVLDEVYGLDAARVALLAVLLLRGPQTPGELRARTARMAEFDSPGSLTADLEVLADQPEPLVRLLPRQPGQKEDRWQQLLATEPEPPAPGPWTAAQVPAGRPAADDPGSGERMDQLAEEMAALRTEVDELRRSLDALRHSLGE
jgi:uncharacterized protein YceH (UPF0502 family)